MSNGKLEKLVRPRTVINGKLGNLVRQKAVINGKLGNLVRQKAFKQWEARKLQRADLGITGRAEPALILRQLLSVYARLQTLLMVASVACPVAQHNVVVLHLTLASE